MPTYLGKPGYPEFKKVKSARGV